MRRLRTARDWCLIDGLVSANPIDGETPGETGFTFASSGKVSVCRSSRMIGRWRSLC